MKTVLFVLDYYLPHRWWVENVFENIILRLRKKWYKIIILTSKFKKSLKNYEVICENDKLDDIIIYRVWKNRISFMWQAIKLWKKILNNKKYNIDVIHASTYGWAIPASILGQKFNKKVILTVHEIFGNLWFKYKGLFVGCIYKIFEQLIFKFSYNKYHCVSNNTAKDLKKYYKIANDKISIIHNWVDTSFWNENNVNKIDVDKIKNKYGWQNKFVFLYFGHAGKSKWIDYLIKALPDILKIDNLIVVFNIIESKRTNLILNKLNNIKNKLLENHPKLENWNKLQIFNWFSKIELRKIIASCDCVIAPSISEWFGSVHTEAVAMGKPLITTNTSAIPEVVYGKVKFIKPNNTLEIIDAVKQVMMWKIQKIPEKKFNWDTTVKEIEKLY